MTRPSCQALHRPSLLLAAGHVALALLFVLWFSGCAGIPALLPMKTTVAAADPLPIDGIYTLQENGKKYQLDAGRSWLLDQLFVGPIRYDPGQVTSRDIFQTAPNEYKGQDLGTMGPLTITAKEDRLELLVLSPLGPVHYTMFPVELEDADWYAAQLRSDIILPRAGNPQVGPAALAAPNPSAPPLDQVSGALSARDRAAFGGYHALVIGNDRYRSLPELATAVNDAEAVSSLLRDRYGFQVTTLRNATRADILRALRAMRTRATGYPSTRSRTAMSSGSRTQRLRAISDRFRRNTS